MEGGEWKLRTGVDMEALYVDCGAFNEDQECDVFKWTYCLSEVTIDAPATEGKLDKHERQAKALLQADNRAGEKRKKPSSAADCCNAKEMRQARRIKVVHPTLSLRS